MKKKRKIKRLKSQVKSLKDLVRHCWIHSGYTDCGSNQMTTEQRHLYEQVIGRKD